MKQFRITGRIRAGSLTVAALSLFLVTSNTERLAAQAETDKPKIADPERATPKTHPTQPELWNVSQMMEDAVMQIARRYNLNKAQENYTRLILKTRVQDFLADHESEVRQLLKESFEMRIKGSKPDDLKSWAERAQPVYEAAMNAILEGNQEWGDILDAEQKLQHEQDLSQMRSQFDRINTMLDGWKGGTGGTSTQTTPSNGSQAPNPQHKISIDPPVATPDIEDEWLQYVNKFILAYGLDAKQDVAARSIYDEQRKKAKTFRESKKKLFDQVRRQFEEATGEDARLKAERIKFALESQIRTLFVELEKRLEAGLTSEQRSGIASDQKQALKDLADEFSGRNMVRRMRRNIKSVEKPRPDSGPKAKDSKEPKSETTTKPGNAVTPADSSTSKPAVTTPAQPPKSDEPPKTKESNPE